MTPAQTLNLIRLVRAMCPAQKFDEYTPEAWHPLLADLDFADSQAALVELGKRQQFIAPADIRAQVGRFRRDRLDREPEAVPLADPNNVPAYLADLRAGRTRVADGTEKPRDIARLLNSSMRSLPSDV